MNKEVTMIEVDIKTYNGHIFTCDRCDKFHFEFNQIGIDFSKLDTLKSFGKYLDDLDEDSILKYNRTNNFNRKIHVQFPGTAIKMVLSNTDLNEIRVLIKTFVQEYELELQESMLIKDLTKLRKGQEN